MWSHAEAAAESLARLPMEVLQAAFWSLDPERTVRKFAEFGRLDPASAEARAVRRARGMGERRRAPALSRGEELIEELFGQDVPGTGQWQVGGRAVTDELAAPTAPSDRRARPASRRPRQRRGQVVRIASGHVGMIVGSARTQLHDALKAFLTPCR